MTSGIHAIIPELMTVFGSLSLTLAAAFAPSDKHKSPWATLAAAALLALAIPFALTGNDRHAYFGGMLVTGGATCYFKALILGSASAAMVLAYSYFKRNPDQYAGEFPALCVASVLGMLLMVSSAHLLSLYVSLELQSLALYVLAAFRRDDSRSSEAGVKYFVLGALSSCLLLFGVSLIYGGTGELSYAGIAKFLQYSAEGKALFGAGAALTLAGLFFKISAAPFHMWTPDVYQGAPKPSVALFAGAAKAAGIAALVNIVAGVLIYYNGPWRHLFFAFGVLSAFVGAFGAIAQNDLRRLIAFSSIGHMGYVLTGLGVGDQDSAEAVAVYALVYLTLTAGFFALLMLIQGDESKSGAASVGEPLQALKGLSKRHPVIAVCVAVLALSLAGVPPFAGFFAKLVLFKAMIAKSCYVPAALAITASAVSAFFYLRLVKVMYFDQEEASAPRLHICKVGAGMLAACAAFNVLFLFGFDAAVRGAAQAFSGLFG